MALEALIAGGRFHQDARNQTQLQVWTRIAEMDGGRRGWAVEGRWGTDHKSFAEKLAMLGHSLYSGELKRGSGPGLNVSPVGR